MQFALGRATNVCFQLALWQLSYQEKREIQHCSNSPSPLPPTTTTIITTTHPRGKVM